MFRLSFSAFSCGYRGGLLHRGARGRRGGGHGDLRWRWIFRAVAASDRGLGACGEIFQAPGGVNAGLRRRYFGFGALPVGFDFVAAVAVHTFFGEFGRRERRIFGEFLFDVELAFDARVNFGFRGGVPDFIFAEILFVQHDGIAGFPVIEHFLGHVFGWIVLGMAAHAHGFHFDEARAAADATFVYGFFRGLIDGDDIVAVHDDAGDAVCCAPVGEILYGHLARNGRGVGPLIILDDQDKRSALRGGEAQAFVECAGGGAAVADPCERDDVLSEVAAGHSDAGHYRD